MAVKKDTVASVTETENPKGKTGLSGETAIVNLFYDGDRYKDPLYVAINGRNWMVKRGEPVEVPVEVANVIEQSLKQDGKTAQMIRQLSGKPKDMGEM